VFIFVVVIDVKQERIVWNLSMFSMA